MAPQWGPTVINVIAGVVRPSEDCFIRTITLCSRASKTANIIDGCQINKQTNKQTDFESQKIAQNGQDINKKKV